jgi:diguanylate cyclase (GGDEF)-like protein
MTRARLTTIGVLVAVMTAVAGTIVAIDRLQSDALAGRDAEARAAALRLELAQIQDVPWGVSREEGDDPAAVRDELRDHQERVCAQLARLQAEVGLPYAGAIHAGFGSGMAHLWGLYHALRDDRSPYPDAGAAARSMTRADRALERAAGAYHADSALGLRKAKVRAITVILVLFAAFAWYFARVAKARRTAEELARANERLLAVTEREARTDALTGLRNRRALWADLEVVGDAPHMVALFDLDGFKAYNDTFGHPAGDALLTRLGERLATTLDGLGTAYRIGGDEFCVLAPLEPHGPEAVTALAATALSEVGDGHAIECSSGFAVMPAEARDAEAALGLADQRMYRHKAEVRAALAQ